MKKHPKLDSVATIVHDSTNQLKVGAHPSSHTIPTQEAKVENDSDRLEELWQEFANYPPLRQPTIFDEFSIV